MVTDLNAPLLDLQPKVIYKINTGVSYELICPKGWFLVVRHVKLQINGNKCCLFYTVA